MKKISGIFGAMMVVVALASHSTAQSIESLMSQGQAYLSNGAYGQAVTSFRQVIAKEPDNFEAQFNLAFSYLQWGQQAKAIDEFKKALALQPRNSEIYSNLAIAYENIGKKEEAIGALLESVKMDPSNITARMNLAAMYVNVEKFQLASSQYKEVIRIDGSNVDAYLNLSKCLIEAGQFAEAKGYLKQVIANDPNKGEAHWELGNIYWKKENDVDKAIAEYKLAIAVEPSEIQFYQTLADAYENKEKKDLAVETLKKSLPYIDDALVKEKVQSNIDRLEHGDTNSKKENAVVQKDLPKLKKEAREENESEKRRIETAPIDVMGDLETVTNENNGLDLKEMAKKRAASK